MEGAHFTSFVVEARARSCRSIDAANSIQGQSVKKSEESGPTPYSNLLPTRQSLRAALCTDATGGAKSHGYIARILRCRCSTLCQPHHAANSEADRSSEEIAKWIARQADRINAFAALALAGCTFACRVWQSYPSLDDLINQVQDENNWELRNELFGCLVPCHVEGRERRLKEFASAFYANIKETAWLFRIANLGRSDIISKYQFTLKYNFPFVKEVRIKEARPQIDFTKCEIAKEYCSSDNLNNRVLFRKATTFVRRTDGTKTRAQREADVLLKVKGLNHPHIVDVLFAFEETLSPEEAVVNLIFPFCEFDLENLLYEKSPADVHKLFKPVSKGASLLSHGLWEAIVNVVDAVDSMHNHISDKMVLAKDERMDAGHFDIKPANIIVDSSGGTARLLLTDFGNAVMKKSKVDQTSGQTGIRATYDYAAPELSVRNATAKKSCDIWSLSCVVLEVLVFIQSSISNSENDTVKSFYLTRTGQSPRGSTDAAFWLPDESSEHYKLRDCVTSRLSKLRDSLHNNAGDVARVVEKIEAMLQIRQEARPSLYDCLQCFWGVDDASGRIFLSNDHIALMSNLSDMKTQFVRDTLQRPLACHLRLWRQRHNDMPNTERLTLVLEALSSRVGRWNDSSNRAEEYIVPSSFLSNPVSSSSPSPALLPDDTMSCSFRFMHKGTTFRFKDAAEYCSFFSLMTYQRLLPEPKVDAGLAKRKHVIRLPGCELTVHRMPKVFTLLAPRTQKYDSCSVQVWSTLSDTRYDRAYCSPNGQIEDVISFAGGLDLSGTNELRGNRKTTSKQQTAAVARFKMAIFARGPLSTKQPTGSHLRLPSNSAAESTSSGSSASSSGENGPAFVCIVFELDTNNVEQRACDSSHPSLVFEASKTHSAFPVAIFKPQKDPAASMPDVYPAIPLSPSVMKTAIRDSKERLEKLELTFKDQSDRDSILKIMKDYNVRSQLEALRS